jgi:antitoxin (DNA-binding transcriptional repressor) of toxin-antitoxin stability system
VITRNGKAIAVILPIEDEDELERLVVAYSRQFQSIIQTARQEIAIGSGIAHDDFWDDIDTDAPEG